MSKEIVEKVARGIVRSRGLDPDEPTFASGNSSGEYLVYNRRYDGEKLAAKAAIRTTLEFYRDNPSLEMLKADPNTATCDESAWAKAKFRAMLFQAIQELDEETV